jgi:hypothetical protein
MVFQLAFTKGNGDAFLVGIVYTHRFMKKVGSLSLSVLWHPSLTTSYLFYFFLPYQGGNLNLTATAHIVLCDWSTGKISWYVVPPAASSLKTASDAVSDANNGIYR